MPKVFEWKGCRFHFFSNEGEPREPCHIHVQKGERRAKFWIEPVVALASNYGYSPKELRDFQDQIEKNTVLIKEKWNEHFSA